MARGIHRVLKVSPGPAMPYFSAACRWDTLETALELFRGWPAHRGGPVVSVFYYLGYPMSYAHVFDIFCVAVWDGDIGIWRGVSKRVEYSHREPALRAGHP
jgi:hypothetical protein